MMYSVIGILATIIQLIINRDILWKRGDGEYTRTERCYRSFLLAVMSY